MALDPGTRLGPYEIISPLGAGGMGEVYQARDTRLNRTVAVKVLHAHLAGAPMLRQRFEREARAVSALNHPHICTLFDVGEQDGVLYLVMEHLLGDSLQARLARGPLPLSEALACAAQIADALDKAHRQGVIHRDLKPGNIMMTKSGAKLLDFGLAKTLEAIDPAAAGLTAAPTAVSPLTAHGMIVGTFQYMAPELLEGATADARSDIFAFGLVLYEMLSGKRAFDGKTQASLAAAILKETPPPITALNAGVPPALERLLITCLEKDPDERRQTMHDVLLELRGIAGERVQSAPAASFPRSTAAAPKSRAALGLATAAGILIAGAAAGYWAGAGSSKSVSESAVAFEYSLPDGHRFRIDLEDDNQIAPPVISPDGTRIVFGVTNSAGVRNLWIRDVGQFTGRPIPGTEESTVPFWAPDGHSIGFASGGKLKLLSLAGGAPITLADTPAIRGASWSPQGVILFAPATNDSLYVVPAEGGSARAVTTLDQGVPDLSHRWPVFLPDGEHFLFLVWSNSTTVRSGIGGIYVGSINGGPVKRLLENDASPDYAMGRLFFAQGRTLMTAAFDQATQQIRGQMMGTDVQALFDPSTGKSMFSLSSTGSIVAIEDSPTAKSTLVWVDRAGAETGVAGPESHYNAFRLSPDGRRVAVSRNDQQAGDRGIWLIDLARGLEAKFTLEPSDEIRPVWSPDSLRVAFSTDADGRYAVVIRPADRSGSEERMPAIPRDQEALDWSPDGKRLLVQDAFGGGDDSALGILDLEEKVTKVWLKREGDVSDGRFSPDGNWVAYVSDESGREEVYVAPYPGPGAHVQISIQGGRLPHIRQDGRELIYQALDGEVKAVEFSAVPSVQAGIPKTLFTLGMSVAWDVSGDHQRFLVSKPVGSGVSPPLKVMTGWAGRLGAPPR